jgi:hypothetical protein
MTDEQFAQLMKKLEDIERQMQAGTWFPRQTYPTQPMPIYYPQQPGQPPFYPWHGQVTD